MAKTRRWDFAGSALPQTSPVGTQKPAFDLNYFYSQGTRVRKTSVQPSGHERHTLQIFDTLRADDVSFDAAADDYQVGKENLSLFLAGVAHAYWDTTGMLPHQTGTSALTMQLIVGDHLGSSSVVINHASSELVERTTYYPFGAIESDYRPVKWAGFREAFKFTGKEEDIEVGAVDLGARSYQPNLGRFMSPDPLTIHGMSGDLNPYSYVGGSVSSRTDPTGLAEGCDPKTAMCCRLTP